MRRFDKEIELCGYRIPSGVKITFLSGVHSNPETVDEPDLFIPERWSSEAVAIRKGTPKEALDNKVIAKPFGYGPRMCIGARLAEVELKAFMTRLVRDWKFEVNPKDQTYKVEAGAGYRAEPYPKMTFVKAT